MTAEKQKQNSNKVPMKMNEVSRSTNSYFLREGFIERGLIERSEGSIGNQLLHQSIGLTRTD